MSEEINKQIQSTVLSRITAAIVSVLLVAFFAVSMNSLATISGQVATIKNGPYPVSVAAGRVETLLVQLRTIAERPSYLNSTAEAEHVKSSYATVDADMRKQLSFIADSHSLNEQDAQNLQAGYEELSARQSRFVELCADPQISDDEVKEYAESNLYPLIDTLIDIDIDILDESTAAVDSMYTTVNEASGQMIFVSCVLMAGVIASIVVYMFILRRKRLREESLRGQLEKALVLAQSASAAKSAFLSNMSHDIRTPMNAIVGLTTIAESHLDDPERVQECLTRITTSSRHLLGLINDVLDMGKIESGKISLNEENFSFPNLITDFITIVQPQARAKRLNFDVTIGNIDQEMLVGDSMRINQILLNLASNAIKYTKEGDSVKISITEEVGLCTNNYQFVVEDTGIGMEPEFLEHIFDPFERERNETTNFTEGTGLGMSITKNIVDIMGGTISVESTVGEGSKFVVTLPLKPAPVDEEAFDLTGFDTLRVLVVDDDRDVLENTLSTLEEFGAQGEATCSGLDALALTTAAHNDGNDFNAIIVDWVMPELDGIETIRRIRSEIGAATPIVLLTAYDWTDIEEEAKEAGVSAFIAKPLFKSRLYHILKTLCVNPEEETDHLAAANREPLTGRVLLVEDNDINSEIACEIISSMGPEVEVAVDGMEALRMVKDAPANHYDLIFMDWQMPRMNGIEATKAIIAYEEERDIRHTPIVAMTANAFNEDRVCALEAGMDGFMAKPISMKELERNLRIFLRKRS